jgi:hypothetical protein
MSPTPTVICANDELVRRYEQLRRHVLDRSAGIDRGPGLALLIHQGMRAWIEVSASCPTTPSATSRQSPDLEDVVTSDQRGQMVMVLVAMALHSQEVNR